MMVEGVLFVQRKQPVGEETGQQRSDDDKTHGYRNTMASIVLYNGNTLKSPDRSFLYFTLPLSQGSDHLKRH